MPWTVCLSYPDPLEGITPRESDVSFTFLLGNWVFFAFLKTKYNNIKTFSPNLVPKNDWEFCHWLQSIMAKLANCNNPIVFLRAVNWPRKWTKEAKFSHSVVVPAFPSSVFGKLSWCKAKNELQVFFLNDCRWRGTLPVWEEKAFQLSTLESSWDRRTGTSLLGDSHFVV